VLWLVLFLAVSAAYLYSFPQPNLFYAAVVLLHALSGVSAEEKIPHLPIVAVAGNEVTLPAIAHNAALPERKPTQSRFSGPADRSTDSQTSTRVRTVTVQEGKGIVSNRPYSAPHAYK